MARTPEQPRKALRKGSESNDPRNTLEKDVLERAKKERPIAEYLEKRRCISEGEADYRVFVVIALGID